MLCEQNCHDWIQEAYRSHGWFYPFEGYKKLELGQVNIAWISFGQLFNEYTELLKMIMLFFCLQTSPFEVENNLLS